MTERLLAKIHMCGSHLYSLWLVMFQRPIHFIHSFMCIFILLQVLPSRQRIEKNNVNSYLECKVRIVSLYKIIYVF
jgi:hypothetical protein